jgi:hypothetical protein
MFYNTSMNSPSPQILGFQNTGIWHLFKNSNSGDQSALELDISLQDSLFAELTVLKRTSFYTFPIETPVGTSALNSPFTTSATDSHISSLW